MRTVASHDSGAWYWEVLVTAGDPNSDDGGLGILTASFPSNATWLGSANDSLGFGYGGGYTTQWWVSWPGLKISSTPPPASSAIGTGVLYMFALDMDAGDLWVGQNGTWYNGGAPATHASPVASGIHGAVYAGVTFYSGSGDAFTADFGASPFRYPVPAGFTAGF